MESIPFTTYCQGIQSCLYPVWRSVKLAENIIWNFLDIMNDLGIWLFKNNQAYRIQFVICNKDCKIQSNFFFTFGYLFVFLSHFFYHLFFVYKYKHTFKGIYNLQYLPNDFFALSTFLDDLKPSHLNLSIQICP